MGAFGALAASLAAAAKVRLGRVQTIGETTSSPPPLAADKAAATPIQAGTVQIEADVTVTYAIA